MNIGVPLGGRHTGTVRSFSGCWTCRLRRKKCDETRPICDVCASLHITCHFGQEKPEWMDGGDRQDRMTAQLRQEVRENAQRRREERSVDIIGDSAIRVTSPAVDCSENSTELGGRSFTVGQRDISFGQQDTVLIMFYLENVLPFLFPFYNPSILRGGRAWLLKMMIDSPVVRQATLCLSPYFFSLARGTTSDDALWETVLTQTRDAFGMLGQALQRVSGSGTTEHLHCAVRIMASIAQLQRFEITVLSFENCQAHHDASLALFTQLLDSVRNGEPRESRAAFDAVLDRLGTSSPSTDFLQIPTSAEQAAFLFSSALLIFDDIVASTVLPEQPRLYEYHNSLLGCDGSTEPRIDLEATVGCQNWVLIQIGEISALDAWKQQCKKAGSLDVMELVRRATLIKRLAEIRLAQLESEPTTTAREHSSVLDVLTAHHSTGEGAVECQISVVTRVWAHAALLYLFVVVSGWQPANAEVRSHVERIVGLLSCRALRPSMLRATTWPFSVAGCLAEPGQEAHFRAMTERLKPRSVFGTVYKALEIMENVWRSRDLDDAATRDLGTCFRSRCRNSRSWWF
ncbi:fungal-specific transcription factor domain-containing protein [Xylaria palmicola]|nr:fungal-specific transcription factor domain-containing protein [Xylaria palmicola]